MNCKIKAILLLLLFCAIAIPAAMFAPPEWGGYGAGAVIAILAAAGLIAWLRSAWGNTRNPFQGAQHLRQEARKIAATDGVDINTAIQEVWDQAKAKGETYPKRQPETMPRPAMEGSGLKAHLTQIRGAEPRETLPFAGYDKAPGKDPERFGVVQQPELTTGSEINGVLVELPNKQHSPIHKSIRLF